MTMKNMQGSSGAQMPLQFLRIDGNWEKKQWLRKIPAYMELLGGIIIRSVLRMSPAEWPEEVNRMMSGNVNPNVYVYMQGSASFGIHTGSNPSKVGFENHTLRNINGPLTLVIGGTHDTMDPKAYGVECSQESGEWRDFCFGPNGSHPQSIRWSWAFSFRD